MDQYSITVFCFLASYLIALTIEGISLWKRQVWQWPAVLFATTAGLVAHTWYLLQRSTETKLPPLLSSTHDWFLVLAWIVVLFYLFFRVAERSFSLGPFLLPVVLLLIGSAYYVSMSPNALLAEELSGNYSAKRGWAMLHAILLLFGISGVILGFLLALMYLIQHRRLKQKPATHTELTLPNLERLARFNWWAVMLSIPLLSLGLFTGVILGVWSKSGSDVFSFKDPVVIINGLAWGVMVVFFVWLIQAKRSAGKMVAWRTIWAFGFLLVTLIGLQLLTSGGHISLETWHT
ncbi:MAG: c-type cytochrome biogenesis protein CcsB [Planctomycetaceae bacterium]